MLSVTRMSWFLTKTKTVQICENTVQGSRDRRDLQPLNPHSTAKSRKKNKKQSVLRVWRCKSPLRQTPDRSARPLSQRWVEMRYYHVFLSPLNRRPSDSVQSATASKQGNGCGVSLSLCMSVRENENERVCVCVCVCMRVIFSLRSASTYWDLEKQVPHCLASSIFMLVSEYGNSTARYLFLTIELHLKQINIKYRIKDLHNYIINSKFAYIYIYMATLIPATETIWTYKKSIFITRNLICGTWYSRIIYLQNLQHWYAVVKNMASLSVGSQITRTVYFEEGEKSPSPTQKVYSRYEP